MNISPQFQSLTAFPFSGTFRNVHLILAPFPFPILYKGNGTPKAEWETLNMPHARCSICNHPDLEAINTARKAGDPVRAIAKRFGITPASADRHFHHEEHEKNRQNIGQITRIDEEIRKLIRAQNRAKKKRDNALALQIAKELRNWFTLRTKAEIAAIGTASENSPEQLSPAEALTLAKAVIESDLHSPEVVAWIEQLHARLGHIVVPATPITEVQADD
jgi:hypothetical protein